jgi:hypothetical protein
MFKYGLCVVGLCFLLTSAYSQSTAAPTANAQTGDQKALL